jgi:flagellar biosynthesis protein FlhF
MLRKELGPEAVILSSRSIRQRGLRGWFQPRQVEVTAACDRENPVAVAVSGTGGGEAASLKQELGEIKALLANMGALSSDAPREQRKLAETLRQADVSSEVTAAILQQVPEGAGLEALQERLAQCFQIPEKVNPRAKRIVALVGPTGVGKTTTLAKLAAGRALQEKKKVALISIDTYRIGAVEQLKIYGDIIGTPVEAVSSPAELKRALEQYKSHNTIYIDTTGRSARKPMAIAELRAFLEGIPNLETYLVLSATTKSRDLHKIQEAFAPLNPDAVIFTKLDETDSLGAMVDLCYRSRLPVAYITEGQNVPDDIAAAEPHRLARLVLGAER